MNQEPSPNAEEEESTLRPTILGMVAMFVILLLVLYAIVAYYPEVEDEDKLCPRIGSGDVFSVWGSKTIISSTEVLVDFGRVVPEPRPTLLTIKLMKDDEDIGTYAFQTNEDGPLILIEGEDVGNLTYIDLADNEKVNIGDRIMIENLSPNSEYVIAMFWAPTSDCMTETYFRTPP
ncbi:MAG: hypothetical protein V3U09_03715 [Thermoplasmata archaeon]